MKKSFRLSRNELLLSKRIKFWTIKVLYNVERLHFRIFCRSNPAVAGSIGYNLYFPMQIISFYSGNLYQKDLKTGLFPKFQPFYSFNLL